jgi:hypothetical protein
MFDPMVYRGNFLFRWTSYPSISYWAPMMVGVLIGLSVVWIFVNSFHCQIPDFTQVKHISSKRRLTISLVRAEITILPTAQLCIAAAFALAVNTIVRSVADALFPVHCSFFALIVVA